MTCAQQSPSAGVEELYNRYAEDVYRLSVVMLRNPTDAEDVVQTTFLKLLARTEPFADQSHAKGWLLKTAGNQCRDLLRHWWRRNLPEEAMGEIPASPAPEPDEMLERVLALPERYKLPLYLCYYEGYTSAEAARLLGKKEATVRSLLHRARKQLKQMMSGEET